MYTQKPESHIKSLRFASIHNWKKEKIRLFGCAAWKSSTQAAVNGEANDDEYLIVERNKQFQRSKGNGGKRTQNRNRMYVYFRNLFDQVFGDTFYSWCWKWPEHTTKSITNTYTYKIHYKYTFDIYELWKAAALAVHTLVHVTGRALLIIVSTFLSVKESLFVWEQPNATTIALSPMYDARLMDAMLFLLACVARQEQHCRCRARHRKRHRNRIHALEWSLGHIDLLSLTLPRTHAGDTTQSWERGAAATVRFRKVKFDYSLLKDANVTWAISDSHDESLRHYYEAQFDFPST